MVIMQTVSVWGVCLQVRLLYGFKMQLECSQTERHGGRERSPLGFNHPLRSSRLIRLIAWYSLAITITCAASLTHQPSQRTEHIEGRSTAMRERWFIRVKVIDCGDTRRETEMRNRWRKWGGGWVEKLAYADSWAAINSYLSGTGAWELCSSPVRGGEAASQWGDRDEEEGGGLRGAGGGRDGDRYMTRR